MILIFRISHFLHVIGIPVLPRLLYALNRIIFSVALPPSAIIGRRVLFGYHGLGIVIHPEAVIGDDVIIGPNAVIGGRGGRAGAPNIKGGVVIGSGAAILGAVTIGNGAQIGSNAVVLSNVPDGATAVGVPSRTLHSSD